MCTFFSLFKTISDNFDILAAFWDPSGLLTELRTLLTLWVWPIPDLFSKFSLLGWDCSRYVTPLLTCLRALLTFWKLLLHTWDSLEPTWDSSPGWKCKLACLELILTNLRNLQTYWLIHLRLFPQHTASPNSLLLCWVYLRLLLAHLKLLCDYKHSCYGDILCYIWDTSLLRPFLT